MTFLDVYAADEMTGLLPEEQADSPPSLLPLRGEMSYGQLTLHVPPSGGTRPRMMWCVRMHGLAGPVRSALLDGRPVECGRASRIVELSFRAPENEALLDVEFEEY